MVLKTGGLTLQVRRTTTLHLSLTDSGSCVFPGKITEAIADRGQVDDIEKGPDDRVN
jgi:hypothetical protein